MKNLADAVLQYYWFLNFCEADELEPDTAVKQMEHLSHNIESSFSEGEKDALRDSARRSFAEWTAEPDKDGYTPRKLFTEDQRKFLQSIIDGDFSGSPEDY